MSKKFILTSEFSPSGDQPNAIDELVKGLTDGQEHQTLLGVTGSGKTFTVANVIEKVQRPTLVLCHNKTLAAQLYAEFRAFFPQNAVEYFVSYYDYYQPEAYMPSQDLYIEKDAAINETLDRLRLAATSSLLTRRDVLIVASVSCLYGLGSPEEFTNMSLEINVGLDMTRTEILRTLVKMQYARNDVAFERSCVRVRGDVIDIWPAYLEYGMRIELFGDTIDAIYNFEPLTGEIIEDLEKAMLFPAKHYVMEPENVVRAIGAIRNEMDEQLKRLRNEGKLLEAQRLESRTLYDLEMMEEIGYTSGIENYSRHLDGRATGSRPFCLIDFFPKDFLTIVDESHVTMPQVRGMYNGDRARKQTLVDHGFRLPSALDNRPVKLLEFEALAGQRIYISATPSPYELELSHSPVEQVVRPTGLLDPIIDVRPADNQVIDLLEEITKCASMNERVLVTALTKVLSEELAQYITEAGLRGEYMHSDLDTVERTQILRELRRGEFDVLVGVNLLREGLDLPEVTLVAILDADKEGFLRSQSSLIQTAGRAARNVKGRVIFYANKITAAMKYTIDETTRRRKLQAIYNEENKITPTTITSKLHEGIEGILEEAKTLEENVVGGHDEATRAALIKELETQMFEAAEKLNFELAAQLRDKLQFLADGKKPSLQKKRGRKKRKHRR